VLSPLSAGNGSLMRCLATGIVRPDARRRRAEAVAISTVTHADQRCVEACAAYCDLVHHLLEGASADEAVDAVLKETRLGDEVRGAITAAGWLEASELSRGGYVVTTLQVGVWALLQPRALEEVLVDVVNLGGDADTTGAVAGGLIGVRDGVDAIPARWLERLEYRDALSALVPRLVALRRCGRAPRSTTEQE
jgi:ADP-ribosylglycohydrolase